MLKSCSGQPWTFEIPICPCLIEYASGAFIDCSFYEKVYNKFFYSALLSLNCGHYTFSWATINNPHMPSGITNWVIYT